MTREDRIAFYEKRRQQFSATLSVKRIQINRVSNLRLLAAGSILITLYFAFSYPIAFYFCIPLLFAFVLLVQYHARLFSEKVHLENLVRINTSEIEALQGNFSSFNPGKEYIDTHHPYTYDLDIFGDGSLFQCINRCNTIDGKKSLATLLSVHLPDAEAILSNQEAIKEVASKTDFRQHLQASGMEIEELVNDRQELSAWLKVPAFIYGNKFNDLLLWILPSLTILALLGWIFFDLSKAIFILLVLVQWTMVGIYNRRIGAFHEFISRKKGILQKYAHILKVIQPENFESRRFKKLKAEATNADVKIGALAGLVSALNARLNFMTSMVMNSIILYDMQCVYRLEKWKEQNSENLLNWLDAIREAEVLASLSTFAFNNPAFIYPVIHPGIELEATGLGHPLLAMEECVTNNISMGHGKSVLIVTGANMAGKSTFLRTMGVNLVLAQSGSPVFASTYKFPIIPIRSGMRTADSLKDHESYFYAELHRLQAIMNELRDGKPLFVLLDEILKGTNSGDKQRGSIALVRQLLLNPCLAMVATHDLALGDLEKEYPERVRNFCFEANIENDQLSFDYILKPGLAQTMNATFLMKKMGIIPE